jgi:hypothetical protein
MYRQLHGKCPLFLRHLNELEFSQNIKKKKFAEIPNLWKMRLVGADLFHADGRTDGWTDRHDMADSHFS